MFVNFFPLWQLFFKKGFVQRASGKFCSKCILGLFKIMRSIACNAGV